MIVGVFSDAHGNLGGFDAALAALRGAGTDTLWYLGDFVGYIPTTEVVARAMALGPDFNALKGNHDEMVLEGTQHGPGNEAIYRHRDIRAALGDAERGYLAALPPKAEVVLDGRRVMFVHGGPHDATWQYVYPDTDLAMFANISCDFVFMGHTHRPFIRRAGETLFVNVGSCGIPRDGSGRGSACTFDTATGEARLLSFGIGDGCRAATEAFDLHEAVLKHFRTVFAQEQAAQ